jgi:hypothetical protein
MDYLCGIGKSVFQAPQALGLNEYESDTRLTYSHSRARSHFFAGEE